MADEVCFSCGRDACARGRTVLFVDISFWVTNFRLLDSCMRPTSKLWGCMQGDTSAEYVNNLLARRGQYLVRRGGTRIHCRCYATRGAAGLRLGPKTPFRCVVIVTHRGPRSTLVPPRRGAVLRPVQRRRRPVCVPAVGVTFGPKRAPIRRPPAAATAAHTQKSRGRSVRGSSVGSRKPGSGIRAESQWVGPWCGSRVLFRRWP